MLKIYGYSTFNPFKVVATAEELGVEYEYEYVDLGKRANQTEDYQEKHPFSKVPVLEVDGQYISESPSICRYLARISGDRLYSSDPIKAADIDSVMDMMNVHIGRWLSVYFWQEIICPKFFDQEPDAAALKEAAGWLEKQLPAIEKRLGKHEFLCGDSITIADTFAFALFGIHEQTSIDLSPYQQIQSWYAAMKDRPAIKKAFSVVFGS